MDDTTKDEISLINIDENRQDEAEDYEEKGLSDSDLSESLKFFEDDYELDRKNLNCCKRYFSPIRGGSLRGSVITLASMCFGTAGLSLPIGMANVGLIPGTIMFLCLSLTCYWSLNILLAAGRAKKVMNYGKLVGLILGSRMSFLLDITNLTFCFGVLMIYEFTISSFSMEVLKVVFGVQIEDKTIKLIQMFTMMVFIQIPLGFLKNMSKLQYAGMVGVFVFIYITIVVFIESFFYYKEGRESGREIQYFKSIDWTFVDSFSIFLYCFSAHNGIFPIYNELKYPTKRRSFKVLNGAVIIQFIMFSVMTYSGFFSLLEKTPSIFISRPDLEMFNGVDYFMIFTKIIYIISLNCSSAVVFNIIRTSAKGIFLKDGEELQQKYDVCFVIGVFILSNFLTFFVDNVVQIIGVIAGVCGVIMSFILPILCHVQTNGLSKSHPRNLFYLFIMGIITIIGIISSSRSMISVFE